LQTLLLFRQRFSYKKKVVWGYSLPQEREPAKAMLLAQSPLKILEL